MGEELTAGVPGHQVFAALQMDVELEKGVLPERSMPQHGWVLPQENTRQGQYLRRRNIHKLWSIYKKLSYKIDIIGDVFMTQVNYKEILQMTATVATTDLYIKSN